MSDRDKFCRRWNLAHVDGPLGGEVLGELLRLGAVEAQSLYGLDPVDGLAGPDTVQAIEAALGINQPGHTRTVKASNMQGPRVDLVPVPSRRGIEQVYGSFRYTEHPTQKGAIVIARKWRRENIRKCNLHTGQHCWIHKLIVDEFAELYRKACEASGYTPKRIGSFVPRHMRWDSSRPLSRHSWGIAVDFDPQINGAMVPVSETKLGQCPEFVDVFEQAGWTWGGRWSTYPDAMHFERVRR